MHSNSSWDQITAESSARPIPLTEDRFRSWIGRQGVFISSLMDTEMTPYRNAKLAIEQLNAARARFIGAVLNKVNIQRHAYYYAPYYRKDYARVYEKVN